jgi:hypothetical protein
MEDNFEYATRNKIRFESKVGLITVEDLWDLPLTSARGASLDDTARGINGELKSETEESFVLTTTNKKKKLLETKLDIVKHVIRVKQDEAEATRNRATRVAEKKELLEILAEKEKQTLVSMDADAIRRRIQELEA